MHYSVMLKEVIEALNLKDTGIYVDATLGYAGHTSEILKRVKRGFIFAFDQDINAINYSKEKLKKISSNFTIIKSNFLYLKEELLKRDIKLVDGILFDLGVSSPQLDTKERGFSYHLDSRLDMRMDLDNKLSAYEVVNTYTEKELTKILYEYGEEKYAKSIAHNIIKERSIKPIETTLELANLVKRSVPYKETLDKHPAKKTFQAIRIEVNHELDILEKSLKDALSILNIKGRIVVITFHSLEDRIVKNTFKEVSSIPPIFKNLPIIPDEYLPKYKLVYEKVITPSELELQENNRSRSSKLRVIERIK